MSGRQRVTITLGRDGGQVVKRSRPDSNDNDMPSSGCKQVVRERLGNNMVDANMYNKNKRQRIDISGSMGDKASYSIHTKSYRRIGRGDLRLKLLKISSSRGDDAGQKTNTDLRQTLSRNRQVSLKYDTRDHLKELNASGSVLQLPPVRSMDGRLPPRRSADDLLQLDSHRKSYSMRPMEGRRHRSPDRLISSSRGLSPPRMYEELEHIPVRSMNASRPACSITNSSYDAPRPIPYPSNTAVTFDVSKSVSQTHAGVVARRSLLLSNEPLTVKSLLHSLGLDKYSLLFEAEEVDMTALRQMGDSDLKDMGMPMGPRKKILLALSALTKQRNR